MGQYLDFYINDVQVIFSLAFRFQENLKTELSALQVCRNLLGCCEGAARERGVYQKRRGGNFTSSDALSELYVYEHVCSNKLLV